MSITEEIDPETGELLGNTKANVAEFTVSEISSALKRTLEDNFGHVRVRGEISGYRGPHTSGHCYFALKDDKSRIEAVIWRGAFGRMRAKLQEGLEVIATGKISAFAGSSKYQIVIENIEPAGVGALMALLEERKRKLAAEGLFETDRKQELPFLPDIIGVVTSPTGAVIRDILHRLNDRFPRRVIVWPVRVQGEGSAEEVAAAIRGLNLLPLEGEIPRPDLIIVARGGGSLEDLWSFNEEVVVRAAAESGIPLISAVGHETDWTLIDLAADWRAPTPSAAAERAVPVRSDLMNQLTELSARLGRGAIRALGDRRSRLIAAARGLPKPDDILALARQRLDASSGRLVLALRTGTTRHRSMLERIAGRLTVRPIIAEIARNRDTISRHSRVSRRCLDGIISKYRVVLTSRSALLHSLSYASVLKRGFAVIRDKDLRPVTSAGQTRPGMEIGIEFHDGSRQAAIGTGKPAGSSNGRPGRSKEGESGQGNLF